jgi:DNA-binding transcriptional ArsR family regulator
MVDSKQSNVQLLGAGGAAAVLHPLRRRILEGLSEPDSASGLSKRFGLARQKVNYHLRELESEGLVELVEERKKGNCVERVVRATARSFLVHPEALGALAADPDRIDDRFSSAYLVAVASRTIHDVAVLNERAAAAGKKIATFTLQTDVRFTSADARHAFAEELSNAIAKLAARYHDETAPNGRRFRFVVAGHPVMRPATEKKEKP